MLKDSFTMVLFQNHAITVQFCSFSFILLIVSVVVVVVVVVFVVVDIWFSTRFVVALISYCTL